MYYLLENIIHYNYCQSEGGGRFPTFPPTRKYPAEYRLSAAQSRCPSLSLPSAGALSGHGPAESACEGQGQAGARAWWHHVQPQTQHPLQAVVRGGGGGSPVPTGPLPHHRQHPGGEGIARQVSGTSSDVKCVFMCVCLFQSEGEREGQHWPQLEVFKEKQRGAHVVYALQ